MLGLAPYIALSKLDLILSVKDRLGQSLCLNGCNLAHLHPVCVMYLTVNGSCKSANSIIPQAKTVEWTEAVS